MTVQASPSSVWPYAFVEGALERADHLRDDPAALDAVWPQAGVIALDADGRALVEEDGGLRIIPGSAYAGNPAGCVFLGLGGGRGWFLAEVADEATAPPSARLDLRAAAQQWPAWQATLFAQARALWHWRRQYRFCPGCGAPLRFERAGWLGRCTQCGREQYPRTDPAIIAAITDGQRLLLARQASWPARRWSVLAGFVEPGETLEQAIAREVMEEAGVRVRTCGARYLGSQPWPFPGALMLGFLAQAEPDPPQAGQEIETARWFTKDEVRAALARDWREADLPGDGIVLPPPTSIARHVIVTWLDTCAGAGGAR